MEQKMKQEILKQLRVGLEEYDQKIDSMMRVIGSKLQTNMDEEMQKQMSLSKHMQDRLKMELMQNDNKVKDEIMNRLNQVDSAIQQ